MFKKKYIFILLILVLFTISSVNAVDNSLNISNNDFKDILQEDDSNNIDMANFNEIHKIENNNTCEIIENSKNPENNAQDIELNVYAPSKITNNTEITGYKETTISISSNSIDATGKINIFIDDELKETLYAQTLYNLNFYEITPNDFKTYGEHTWKVIYEGDSNFNPTSKIGKIIFEKNKKTPFDYVDVTFDENINTDNSYYMYIQTDPEIYSQPLNIFIDNECLFTYAKKNMTLDLSKIINLTPKEHSWSIILETSNSIPLKNGTFIIPQKTGDENTTNTTNDSFNISAEIKTPNFCMLFNSSELVNLTLPNDATGNLTVYLGKTKDSYELFKTQKLVNGTANIEIFGLPVGYSYLKVNYNGNYKVENITDYKLEVQPIITKPQKMTWGEHQYITIQTDEYTNGTFSFYIYDKLYKKVEVINGSGKISLEDVPIKEYMNGTSILYNTNAYEFNSSGYLFTVKPIIKLNATKTTIYYGDVASYSVKITGLNDKVLIDKYVTFKIGPKSFRIKTNSKGVATLKIPNTITSGKYTIKVIYDKFSTTKTLTIKQVLILKSIKVKKSAKKLVLTATLKKGKNPIKSKYVTFKFNGKSYKIKTNKYGIAKLTLKKSALKNLKIGKKVTYQVTYLKTIVKKTTKVKK